MTTFLVNASLGSVVVRPSFSAETDIPVYVAEDPLTCVVLGTAKYLELLDGAI